MKKHFTIGLILILILSSLLTGCTKQAVTTSGQAAGSESPEKEEFDAVLARAAGTTVTYYAWGGNTAVNQWIDTVLAQKVKGQYDITLKRVPVDDIQLTISKLLNEKQAGVTKGTVDLMWINGENFFTAKENGLLYGPITQDIPNFDKYVDTEAPGVNYDFGCAVEGYEAPFCQAQFVLINDAAVTPETPMSAAELMDYVKKYPGTVTYPAPPDFTGSAFVRNILCEIVDYDEIQAAGADKEAIRQVIRPALDYLQALKPYLWQNGRTYPASIAQLNNMFADGEIVMTMSYEPSSVSVMIESGQFRDTARAFIFENGMTGNTSFFAIAHNSTNVDGALAVINAMLTPEIQASKYDPTLWGTLPILDTGKLSDDEKALFDQIPLGQGALPLSILLERNLPELSADMVPLIEEIWLEEIPGA